MEGTNNKKVEEQKLTVKEVDLTDLTDPATSRAPRRGCGLWSGHCSSTSMYVGCGLWNGDCHQIKFKQ